MVSKKCTLHFIVTFRITLYRKKTMNQILQFKEIGDCVKMLNLGVVNKFPDFFIYDYSEANPEACTQLPVFRQNYFEISLEITDSCSSVVDQFELPATRNRLVLISPNRLQTIKSHTVNGTTHKGYGIFFKPEFIRSYPKNSRFLNDYPYFSHLNTPFIALEKKETAFYSDLIKKILFEYNSNGIYSRTIIRNYLNILLLKAGELYSGRPALRKSGMTRDREIYEQFSHLVQTDFLQSKSVHTYAEKMHITPKHLSETIKKISGRSALELIHQTQVNYAKALLRQTPKTVSEIAYDLNFENPEYFSVFFKRLTGISPSKFRN